MGNGALYIWRFLSFKHHRCAIYLLGETPRSQLRIEEERHADVEQQVVIERRLLMGDVVLRPSGKEVQLT